jgi:hypothetical protein
VDRFLEMVWGPWGATLIVCGAYLLLLVLTRRRIIWAEDRGLLFAHLDKLEAELAGYPEHLQLEPSIESIRQLLARTRERVEEGGRWRNLFASGSVELQAWYSIHDAKLMLAKHWSWPQTKVRLQSAIVELENGVGARRQEGLNLATKLRELLRSCTHIVPEGEQLAEAKAGLQRALRIIYSLEGEAGQRATLWHNKILWLSCCSLLFIIVLTGSVGLPQLFLFGALGGFVSKLVRLRTHGETPDNSADYNWTSLFVVVPLGALMGWSGVMMVALMHEAGMLGTAFDVLKPGPGNGVELIQLSIAFLCGFSERLFDQVIDKGTARIGNAVKLENAPDKETAKESAKDLGKETAKDGKPQPTLPSSGTSAA